MENWRIYAARWPYVSMVGLAAIFLALVWILLRPEAVVSRHGAVAVIEGAGSAVELAAPAYMVDAQTPIAAALAGVTVVAEDKVTLIPAPEAAVTEKTATGPLPMIADDGRKPWQVYARPFTADKAPHIAIVIAPVGGDQIVANAAIERLPGVVTLAIDAQASGVGNWLTQARQAGHETVLIIPAEPVDFPASDPGAGALLSELPAPENTRRFLSFLRQGSGYIGVTTLSGSRFVSQSKAMQPILDEINRRGLAVLDVKIAPRSVLADLAKQQKVPVVATDFRLSAELAPDAIDQTLLQAQRQAVQSGQAVILVAATPLAIDRLNRWLVTLPQAGIVLTPLSALLR